MRRKRFYKNVKRNQTWTEAVQGREIDFADKYADNGVYSDKFDYLRPKQKPKSNKKKLKKKLKRFFRALAAVFISIAVVGAGYTAMDVYMIRHRMPNPDAVESEQQMQDVSQVSLNLKSEYIDIVSLDGADMLSAVLSDADLHSFSSVAFDIKRADGTVAYKSNLANIHTYGATAFPAAQFQKSVDELNRANVFPVAVVCCYADNIVPAADHTLAVLNDDGSLYEDSDGNTYLNPDSEDVYGYIRDIIEEIYNQGITAFVLTGTDLPAEISGSYGDGFKPLADRLYSDIGTGLKFVEAVHVQLGEKSAEEKNDEISKKIKNDLTVNQVYFITTSADKYLIKEKLEESGIVSFILADK